MNGLFSPDDVDVEYIWRNAETGAVLQARHSLTGITIDREIGHDAQSLHRNSLIDDLLHKIERDYPPQDFVWEHSWLGPGKGASWRFVHLPSGIYSARNIGVGSFRTHRREIVAELFQKLRESKPHL